MLIYGHRGGRGEAPENTLAGFRHAIGAGVLRVELDIRLSKDGVPVVIHDPTVNRTTFSRGRVAALDAVELATLDARRGGPPCPERQPISRLVDVLKACPEMLHWQLEAKAPGPAMRATLAAALIALWRKARLKGRATITSFDAVLLRVLREQDAAVPRGYITDRESPDPVATALALGAEMLALDHRIATAKRIAAAQAAGLHVSAWTVNDLRVARRLERAGIDSIITDFPAKLRAAGFAD